MLIVALLPLISIGPAYTEDYRLTFLAFKNKGSGLEVYTLFPDDRSSRSDGVDSGASQSFEHEPQMHFIPGHNLSSWCGEQYFQCQELLVETSFLQGAHGGGTLNIVFVPLEKGILLLSYWYNSNTMMEWNSFTSSSSNCSPTVFYKISSKFYMVCISSMTYEYFASSVYEVQLKLNSSVIEDVTLFGPLTEINISTSLSSSSLSNFILVEHMIYFAVDNSIIVMDIFDSTLTLQYLGLPRCTRIHKLVPTIGARSQLLLVAYCIDRYIYLDPQYGDWATMHLFSAYGVPYLCPDNNYGVLFFH